MGRRSFTFNGKTYSDTDAGALKAAKDDYAERMRDLGHRMTWRKRGRSEYDGNCRRCGGSIIVGSSFTSSGGYDIRRRRCS